MDIQLKESVSFKNMKWRFGIFHLNYMQGNPYLPPTHPPTHLSTALLAYTYPPPNLFGAGGRCKPKGG